MINLLLPNLSGQLLWVLVYIPWRSEEALTHWKQSKGGKDSKGWNPNMEGRLYQNQTVTVYTLCGREEQRHYVGFMCENYKERKGDLKG